MEKKESNILFSIKPKYIKLILDGSKKYEYRTHLWNVEYPYWFTVYESYPVCAVKYRMLLDQPYKDGEIINDVSYGIDRFNNGEMIGKYAYPIKEMYRLDKSIDLIELRKLNVHPPQFFMYIDKNIKLKEKLNKI